MKNRYKKGDKTRGHGKAETQSHSQDVKTRKFATATHLEVYPNPVSQGKQLTISRPTGLSSLTLYSSTGRKIHHQSVDHKTDLSLSLNNYISGRYTLMLNDSKGGVHYLQVTIVK